MGFWRQRDAEAYVSMLHAAEQAGVPMQRWRETRRAWPWTWVHTHLVPGRPMQKADMQPAQVQAVARAVAALHTLQGPVQGPLWGVRPWGGEPARKLLQQFRWAVRRSGVAAAVQKDLLDWLAQQAPVFGKRKVWALTHGDIKPANWIWNEAEGRAYLIDYEHMQYHWPELELAGLLERKYKHRKYRAPFLEVYLANCPSDVAQSWQQDAEVFLVAQFLQRAFRRWLQWRFAWFGRMHAHSGQQRLDDLRTLVERAHQRVVGG